MELLQMQYFVRVAELESVSKAAASLHVSQPTVSGSIIRLENELGMQLFDRVGRRIKLNEKGDLFLQGARRALNEIEATTATLSGISVEHWGKVTLGVFVPITHISDCVSRFALANPHAAFEINGHIEIAEMMRSQAFDLSFFPDTEEFAEVAGIPIGRDSIGAILPSAHPLAARESLHLSDLKNEEFIFTNNSNTERQQLLKACFQAGFTPQTRVLCNSAIALKQLVEYGLGVGLVRSGYVDEFTKGADVSYVPLLDSGLGHTVMLGCKKTANLSEVARAFRDFALAYFHLQANEETLRIFERAPIDNSSIPEGLRK